MKCVTVVSSGGIASVGLFFLLISVMMCPGPADWVLMLVGVMLGAGLSNLTIGKAVGVANR